MRFDGRPQHLRIGHQEIARRQRVDELAGVAGQLVALAVDVGNLILQRRQLLQIAEMAALTGAQDYDDTNRAYPIIEDPDGEDSARAYVLLRGILCPGPDCDVARIAADTSIGCLNNNECLRVTLRRTVMWGVA